MEKSFNDLKGSVVGHDDEFGCWGLWDGLEQRSYKFYYNLIKLTINLMPIWKRINEVQC